MHGHVSAGNRGPRDLLASWPFVDAAVVHLWQIEAHPYFPNTALIKWAQSLGMHVTAYRCGTALSTHGMDGLAGLLLPAGK